MHRDISARLATLDWDEIGAALDGRGFAVTAHPLLSAAECATLARTFDDNSQFRSTIDMARHRFGDGCYRYYRYPLPPAVAQLREAAYPRLAAIANRWAQQLG